MSADLYIDVGYSDDVDIVIEDYGMKMSATVRKGNLEDALGHIAEDISEWIAKKVLEWVDNYFDLNEQMTQEQFDLVRTIIEEARP